MYRTNGDHALVLFVTSEMVVALDRSTGARAWEIDTRRAPLRHVEVVDDRVVAGGAGGIVCLDYATGRLIWDVSSPVTPTTWLVDRGLLVVGGAGEVAAFDLASGALLWHDRMSGFGVGAVGLAVVGARGAT